MTSRSTGIALAFVTACISGVSIWVNGRGLAHFSDATVYTTAKDLVAGVVLESVEVEVPEPGEAA